MDVIRASAIVLVVVGHTPIFFHQHYDIVEVVFLAMFGVELFFVLSGFLIGHILIDLVAQGLQPRALGVFWLKRWFRTLPAYLFVAISMMLIRAELSWTHFFFLQNWFPSQLERFPASWSLSIEEWFYVSFPIVLLVLASLSKVSRRDWDRYLIPTACGLFIAVPWALRAGVVGGAGEWDLDVRKQVFLRLDAIAFGVALAWYHRRGPSWFGGARLRASLGVGAALGLLVCWVYYHRHIGLFPPRADWINATVFFPGVTLVCVCFTALAIPLESYRGGYLDGTIRFLSVTSYALYLVHLQIFVIASKQVSTPAAAWGWFAAAVAALLFLGGALHRSIERPFMEMRRRFDPEERVTPRLVSRT